MMRNTILFFSIVLFLCGIINAQNNPDTSLHLLTPKQMQGDVEFYYEKLLETHPNPYQKRTPEQLEQLKNEILFSLNEPLSKEAFYKKVAIFNTILDGHTRILNYDFFASDSEDKKQEKLLKNDKTAYPYSFFCFAENSVALLELNTFFPPDLNFNDTSSEKFIFLKNSYSQYKFIIKKFIDSTNTVGCQHLFIDISANFGGNSSLGLVFLDFFQSAPTKKCLTGSADVKVSAASREYWKYELSFWDNWKILFEKPYRKMFLGKKGKIVHKDYYWKNKEKEPLYKGNVYLIQSRYSFSAAITIASFFKVYKVGPIIGEETGELTGEYRNAYLFILPNSKLNFICAVQYSETVGSNRDGRGVLPDIEYKIEDPHKSFTLEQLKEMLQLVEEKKAEDK